MPTRNKNLMLKVDIEKTLPDFSLRVAFETENEILVLFGPSGAGKTLTLGSIAGFVKPHSGIIKLDDRVLFESPSTFVPMHRRGIGVVFQGYALFPHMTVAQNVAYGLRYMQGRGAPVQEMLARLHLQDLAHRYPHQLSGGQQQRVALGRALIVKPSLLLLDEPFSALDKAVREELQTEIVRLQREFQLTVVVITHDLDDAFALGDKLAVLRNGRVCQFGGVNEVFNHPASAAVAKIMGATNLFYGTVTGKSADGVMLAWGDIPLRAAPADVSVGDTVPFFIRPEDVKVIHPDKPLKYLSGDNLLNVTVTRLAHRGAVMAMRVNAPHLPQPIAVRFPQRGYRDLQLREGKAIQVSLRWEAVQVLPPA